MAMAESERRRVVIDKVRYELAELDRLGVIVEGNVGSSVLFVKGVPGEAEQAGRALLSGADGKALKASLAALNYAPEEWLALAAWAKDRAPLDPPLLRRAVCALDPVTLVATDATAAMLVREAYADELVALDDIESALLVEGRVVRILGMRVLALGGFEEALASPRRKQVMWARLKRIPPVGSPY